MLKSQDGPGGCYARAGIFHVFIGDRNLGHALIALVSARFVSYQPA